MKALPVQRTVPDRPAGHPDDQTTDVRPRCPFPIAKLGSLIDDLIEGRVDVIGKLDLGDWFHTLRGRTNGESHNALFSQRGVEDSLRPELGLQVHRTTENSSKGDIFTKQDDLLGSRQSRPQCGIDRLIKVQTLRAGRPRKLQGSSQ